LASTSGGRFLRRLRKVTTLQSCHPASLRPEGPSRLTDAVFDDPEHLPVRLVRRLRIELGREDRTQSFPVPLVVDLRVSF